MPINFSSEPPYFDDFSEDKHFHKVLFKPGYAVQARELNQIQTILQNQISRHGNHIFKEGSMVIPGQVSFDNDIYYVKLKEKTATGKNSNAVLSTAIGKKIVGSTSGVIAEVVHIELGRHGDPATLFVRYISGGNTGSDGKQYNEFISEEVLTYIVSEESLDVVVNLSLDGTHTGKGAIVSIERGVYYTNGYFVLVDKQILVISRYDRFPTARVGLLVTHKIVTSDEDESLLDNALNMNNYAAPGADRYQINLTLQSRDINSEEDKNFIELLRVENGIVRDYIRSTEYSVLEDTLARRTYDESGNYVVCDFRIDVREHRNNDRGTWVPAREYLIGDIVLSDEVDGKLYTCNTTHSSNDWSLEKLTNWKQYDKPSYNRGIYTQEEGGDESKLALAIEAGKAYVHGYEIEKISTEYVPLNKARESISINHGAVTSSVGNYVIVEDLYGIPYTFDTNIKCELRSDYGLNGELIGHAWIRGIEKHNSFSPTNQFKLFLFDVEILPGKYPQYVKSIGFGEPIPYEELGLVDPNAITGNTTGYEWISVINELNSVKVVSVDGNIGDTLAYGAGYFIYSSGSATNNEAEFLISGDGGKSWLLNTKTQFPKMPSQSEFAGAPGTLGDEIEKAGSKWAINMRSGQLLSHKFSDGTTFMLYFPNSGRSTLWAYSMSNSSYNANRQWSDWKLNGLPHDSTPYFDYSGEWYQGSPKKPSQWNGTNFLKNIIVGNYLFRFGSPYSFKTSVGNCKLIIWRMDLDVLHASAGDATFTRIDIDAATIQSDASLVVGSGGFYPSSGVMGLTYRGTDLHLFLKVSTGLSSKYAICVLKSSDNGSTWDQGKYLLNDGTLYNATLYPGNLLPTNIYLTSMKGVVQNLITTNGTKYILIDDGTDNIISTTDMTTFTISKPFAGSMWTDLLYAEDKFVLLAREGSTKLATSADGVTWTARNIPQGHRWTSLAYGDGLMMASSAKRLSTDVFNVIRSGTHISEIVAPEAPSGITKCAHIGSPTDPALFTIMQAESSMAVYPLPYSAIKSIDPFETSYTVLQRFSGIGVSADGTVVISTTSGNFASNEDEDNYLVIDLDDNGGKGALVAVPSENIIPSGNTLSISGLTYSQNVEIVAAVERNLPPKTKEINTFTKVITTQADATASKLTLECVDGYKVISIKTAPGKDWDDLTVATEDFTVEISDRYILDNGQRDAYYDRVNLLLKPSYTPPDAPIRIVVEYFNHVGSGDYFDLSSYTDIRYEDIPHYKHLALRDCLDFRPAVDSNGNFTFAFNNTVLSIKRGTTIYSDFEYYLPRKSRLALSSKGEFSVLDGDSSLSPSLPDAPKLSMPIASIDLTAYTFDTTENNIVIKKDDNRRYTMRDIGKLERRIENLEYYTALSLLEQETLSTDIVDSAGDSRFKNGFIVDSFNGQGVGDVGNSEYRCSIDMERGICRPFFNMRNINLINAINSVNTPFTARNYAGCVMMPILTHVPFIKQPYGSRIENVNPFAVYSFDGVVKLIPSSDDWFETNRKPDIVNNVEGNFNAIQAINEKEGVLGTVWNSWSTHWSGKPTVTNQIQDVKSKSGKKLYENLWETASYTGVESKKGIQTYVTPKINKVVIDDKVLSTSLIPYVRSRQILIKAVKLKPNTNFYAFFDGINVDKYVSGVKVMRYSKISGTFDDESTSNSNIKTEKERYVDGESVSCYSVGDIIRTAGTSPIGTAVVTGVHEIDGISYLRLANIKNESKFTNSTVFTGSISGAEGRIELTSGSVFVNAGIKSNVYGELDVVFTIPNSDSVRFRTGVKEFKLLDSKEDVGTTSSASGYYAATGILETKQANVNAVRDGEIATRNVTSNNTVHRSVTKTIKEPTADFTKFKPSVVSRTVESLSVDDLGIIKKKTKMCYLDPLAQTFLVESRGGAFLSKVDLFFSSKDSEIPVSMEIREVVNGYPSATVLPFSRVVKKAKDVKISNNKVLDLEGRSISKYDTPTTFEFSTPVYVNDGQEYCLVVMSDSNKYNLWISQIGDIIPGSSRTISEQPYNGVLFKSQNASTWTADQYQDMMFTIYKAKFDTTKQYTASFVNDEHPLQTLESDPLHLKVGKTYMRIFQADHGFKVGDRVTISGVSNLPASFNKQYSIIQCQLDSYLVSIGDIISGGYTITKSGYYGGDSVKSTRNIKFSVMKPQIKFISFTETNLESSIMGRSYVNGSMYPAFSPILLNNDNTYKDELVVKAGNEDSLILKCTLSTTNENLSPVLDTDRCSIIAVNNKCDYPTIDNTNYGGFDDNNIDSFYVPDIKSGSSTYSANVTRAIRINNICSMLSVKFAANVPASSDIEVYQRSAIGDSNILANADWIQVKPTSPIIKTEVGNDTYVDIDFLAELDSRQFNVVQVKIVFKTTNPAVVPSIKDLRIVALS